MDNKFVVAIGSSAGGLTPMTTFFDFLPHDQASYVILRHLPVDYKSHLQQILKRHSKLTIVEADNGTPIEKDTIYMSPPSMYMTIKDDKLYLHQRVKQELFPNHSIDIFLESLAEAKGKFCIAVILSGTGSDGSKGISFIKEAGGMIMAQTIESCEHTAMPQNAINTGNVDYELLPSEMPPIILQHIADILKNTNVVHNLKQAGNI